LWRIVLERARDRIGRTSTCGGVVVVVVVVVVSFLVVVEDGPLIMFYFCLLSIFLKNTIYIYGPQM
tara:strand:- start:308 stop:505 length:198 start_codon:yes stop_codon:yes gene_type:complete